MCNWYVEIFVTPVAEQKLIGIDFKVQPYDYLPKNMNSKCFCKTPDKLELYISLWCNFTFV